VKRLFLEQVDDYGLPADLAILIEDLHILDTSVDVSKFISIHVLRNLNTIKGKVFPFGSDFLRAIIRRVFFDAVNENEVEIDDVGFPFFPPRLVQLAATYVSSPFNFTPCLTNYLFS
jgi:hypothetical protein